MAGVAEAPSATLQRGQEAGQTGTVRWPQAAGGGTCCHHRCSLSPHIGHTVDYSDLHDYACNDGCCISSESCTIVDCDDPKAIIDNVNLSTISTNMISISMLNVCSLPSKLDLPDFYLPDFIECIESHTINCFVETKINEIYVDNLSIPASYKGKFKCRKYC